MAAITAIVRMVKNASASVQDDLSLDVVIAVGCVCGFIVLLLLIILVMLCYQRHRAMKKCENLTNRNLSPLSSVCLSSSNSSQLTAQKNSNDSAVNRPEMANNQIAVFKTQTSLSNPQVQYNPSASGEERGSHLADCLNTNAASGENEKNYEMEKIWKKNATEKSLRPLANKFDFKRSPQDRHSDVTQPSAEVVGCRSKKIIHEVVV